MPSIQALDTKQNSVSDLFSALNCDLDNYSDVITYLKENQDILDSTLANSLWELLISLTLLEVDYNNATEQVIYSHLSYIDRFFELIRFQYPEHLDFATIVADTVICKLWSINVFVELMHLFIDGANERKCYTLVEAEIIAGQLQYFRQGMPEFFNLKYGEINTVVSLMFGYVTDSFKSDLKKKINRLLAV